MTRYELLAQRVRSIEADMTPGPWHVIDNHAPKFGERTYSLHSDTSVVCRSGRIVDWTTMKTELWGIPEEADADGIAELRDLLPDIVAALAELSELKKA